MVLAKKIWCTSDYHVQRYWTLSWNLVTGAGNTYSPLIKGGRRSLDALRILDTKFCEHLVARDEDIRPQGKKIVTLKVSGLCVKDLLHILKL
jgi:hypothetical protein